MKKYEGITLPMYRPWDLEKFQARPASRRGGVGERKDMKHGNREQGLKCETFVEEGLNLEEG